MALVYVFAFLQNQQYFRLVWKIDNELIFRLYKIKPFSQNKLNITNRNLAHFDLNWKILRTQRTRNILPIAFPLRKKDNAKPLYHLTELGTNRSINELTEKK